MYMFFFQAEDGIRDLVRSRGLGDVYKRQAQLRGQPFVFLGGALLLGDVADGAGRAINEALVTCLLYTSDAADERSSVDLGGRRIINKKNNDVGRTWRVINHTKNNAQLDRLDN